MYSLDINFLNDRSERASAVKLGGPRSGPQSPMPLYVGLGVAIALPALALGSWFIFQNRNAALAQRQAELESQLTALKAQLSQVDTIKKQVETLEADNRSLATVFDRIKPWSALLQDVRDRVPNGVQIAQIEQLAPQPPAAQAAAPSPSPSPSPAPGAAPPPTPEAIPAMRITGRARSFNDVNDFVLTLQQSPFLDGETTRLVTSKLANNGVAIKFTDEEAQGRYDVTLPQVVDYTIESSLTNLPASELLQDLEKTLSVGLASRIQALRDRGVLK